MKQIHRITLLKKLMLFSSCCLAGINTFAQTVTIYRSGLMLSPTYTTVAAAITAAATNDSLVLSANHFNEHDLMINKSLKLTGSVTALDSTIIDAKGLGRGILINSGDITLMNVVIQNGKINNDAGGGICNYGSGTLILSGNSMVLNCQSSGIYANGGGIYTAGILDVKGNAIISGNYAIENGGGIYAYTTFYIHGNTQITNNSTAGSGGGIFSATSGSVNLSEWASVQNNAAAVAGGGLYGVGLLNQHVSISNNKADYGGGVASFGDTLMIYDSVNISNNIANTSGGGIWLNNASCFASGNFAITNNKIPTVTGTVNFGGAIYNVNGHLKLRGGTITGNQSPVAAIYSSIGAVAKTIQMNSLHLFNPNADGTRQIEIYNSPSIPSSIITFSSDTCWWGSNDTTGLVHSKSGTTGTINSWVKTTWSVNFGNPIDTLTVTFPVAAKFTMNDNNSFDSTVMRSIRGSFMASNGTLTPTVALIDTNNLVRSKYRVPSVSDSIIITAIIDADTFRTAKIGVRGVLSVKDVSANSVAKVFPNPTSETLFITGVEKGSTFYLYTMDGRNVLQQNTQTAAAQINMSGLPIGTYILQITDTNGLNVAKQILKK